MGTVHMSLGPSWEWLALYQGQWGPGSREYSRPSQESCSGPTEHSFSSFSWFFLARGQKHTGRFSLCFGEKPVDLLSLQLPHHPYPHFTPTDPPFPLPHLTSPILAHLKNFHSSVCKHPSARYSPLHDRDPLSQGSLGSEIPQKSPRCQRFT